MGADVLERYHHIVRYLEALVSLGQPRRQPKAEDERESIGLVRMRRLLAALDHPQRDQPVIHVGGTSGKGSVVTHLTRVLHGAGLRVSALLSPHVTTALERFLYNDRLMDVGAFIAAFDAVRPHIEREYLEGPGGAPSYQESLFAMLLVASRALRVDLCVAEVGLGGRFDSTNVLEKALVTIITDVGLDHVEILGRERVAIAKDKAGILKPNVLAMTAARFRDALDVITREAEAVGAPLWRLGREIRVIPEKKGFVVSCPAGEISGVELPDAASFRQRNAALIAATCLYLRSQGYSGLNDRLIRATLKGTFIPGRFESIDLPGGCRLVLDSAHNPDKIDAFCESWRARYGNERSAVVVAIPLSKDAHGMLQRLEEAFDLLYLTRPLRMAHKMRPPHQLREMLRTRKPVAIHLDPWDGVCEALERGVRRIAVTGSTYLVGDIRQRFEAERDIILRGRPSRLDGGRCPSV